MKIAWIAGASVCALVSSCAAPGGGQDRDGRSRGSTYIGGEYLRTGPRSTRADIPEIRDTRRTIDPTQELWTFPTANGGEIYTVRPSPNRYQSEGYVQRDYGNGSNSSGQGASGRSDRGNGRQTSTPPIYIAPSGSSCH